MDSTDLTRVFTTMRGRLRRIAAAIAGDSNADDALQEAFVRLWGKAVEAAPDCNAEAISVAAVKNRSIDMARRRQSQATAELREANVAEADGSTAETDTAERFDRVRRIIEQALPDRQREVLWMRDYDGLPFGEIASRIGTSEANVRQLLSRARKQVRQIYKEKRYDNR